MFYLHRMVAHAFCETERRAGCITVDHKDRDTKNNKASNLEWITHAEVAGVRGAISR